MTCCECSRGKVEEEVERTRSQWIRIIVALAVVLAVGACGKKKVASAPPPPPPSPAPTASLTANPNTIPAGQASTLTWKTDYATDVTIDQLGKVDPSGSRAVTPAESTTYHLVAKNDSGTQEATARITVVSSPPPPQQTSGGTDEQLFSENMKMCSTITTAMRRSPSISRFCRRQSPCAASGLPCGSCSSPRAGLAR